jgi:NAD-dependent dihydropyrimidine dehydrogenase PreA subunit
LPAVAEEVEPPVTYVIAEPCIDVKDKACVDECPVDCIYEGERMLYIHPSECVDCGACEPVCPVEAIFYEDDVPEQWAQFTAENARFFDQLGSPGGAARTGPCPMTPIMSLITSPAGNATVSLRQIPERGGAMSPGLGQDPSSGSRACADHPPAARAVWPASR